MTDPTVSPAEHDDVSLISQILHACGLSFWAPEDIHLELDRSDSILLVIFSGDRSNAFGFISGRLIPSASDKGSFDAEIYNIGVSQNFRRGGAGTRLLKAFLDLCSNSGAVDVWLEARESNTSALQFYEAHGFTRTGIRKGFYRGPVEDAVMLKRTLKTDA